MKKPCVSSRFVLEYLSLAHKCAQEKHIMKDNVKYYMVRQKSIPEVLLKVVEDKGLLESEKVGTIQDAVDAVGISRSSFYN